MTDPRDKLLKHRKRIITSIWIRTMAAGLVRRGGVRYNKLMDEIRQIANKEMRRKP